MNALDLNKHQDTAWLMGAQAFADWRGDEEVSHSPGSFMNHCPLQSSQLRDYWKLGWTKAWEDYASQRAKEVRQKAWAADLEKLKEFKNANVE